MSQKKPSTEQTKKPRLSQLQVSFDSAGSGRVQLWGDGSLSIVDENGQTLVPSRVQVSSAYERDGGKPDKVLARAPGNPSAMNVDVNSALSGFSSVFAVDTNTQVVRGVRVSVCVSLRLADVFVAQSQWRARVAEAAAVEFHDASASPEHIGWNYAVRSIEGLHLPPPVALVVDSDLNALPSINNRERPYFANEFLPQGFTLLYGSSDAGTTEFIGNKAIAMCDRFAAQILRQIGAGADTGESFSTASGMPFTRWRSWRVTATKVR